MMEALLTPLNDINRSHKNYFNDASCMKNTSLKELHNKSEHISVGGTNNTQENTSLQSSRGRFCIQHCEFSMIPHKLPCIKIDVPVAK